MDSKRFKKKLKKFKAQLELEIKHNNKRDLLPSVSNEINFHIGPSLAHNANPI